MLAIPIPTLSEFKVNIPAVINIVILVAVAILKTAGLPSDKDEPDIPPINEPF